MYPSNNQTDIIKARIAEVEKTDRSILFYTLRVDLLEKLVTLSEALTDIAKEELPTTEYVSFHLGRENKDDSYQILELQIRLSDLGLGISEVCYQIYNISSIKNDIDDLMALIDEITSSYKDVDNNCLILMLYKLSMVFKKIVCRTNSVYRNGDYMYHGGYSPMPTSGRGQTQIQPGNNYMSTSPYIPTPYPGDSGEIADYTTDTYTMGEGKL